MSCLGPDEDEMQARMSVQMSFDGHLAEVSKSNELAAWDVIVKACDLVLSNYPTTLHEDIAILQQDDKDGALGFNKRNCILFRKGEKVVLHFFKHQATKVKKLLSMSRKAALAEINSKKHERLILYTRK